MNMNKPLPQNIEAEQASLGSILIDGKLIKEASKIIAVGDFYVSNSLLYYRIQD